jgi:adenosylmethionine-8-amino-7-oxononanoate aminotransferase
MNQKQIFLAHQAQTTHFPLMMEMAKAEGNYIYDTDGKKYLDLISGISVSHLGHGNTAVKEAIKNQVDDYMHLMVYGEFIQSPQIKLSQKLSSLLPNNLDCIYLVNSGAEATDGALKLAKRITKRSKIIANKNEMTKKFAGEKIIGWVIGGDFNSNHDGQFTLCTAIQDMVKAGFHNSWKDTPLKDRLTWRNNPRFEDFRPTTFDYIFTQGFAKRQATLIPNVSLKVSDHAPVILELCHP